MASLRFILGDQLTRSISSLADSDAERDVVLMVEVAEEATYVRHHKQKIAFIFSAMRHFAAELRAEGFHVHYVQLDDAGNTGSFTGELQRAVERHRSERVIVTEPGEWRVLEAMRGWEALLGLPVDIRDDDRFFASREGFARWARDRKVLRMEFFYRDMRRDTGLPMEGAEPTGGQWNFDPENRKALPRGAPLPSRLRFSPDTVTGNVLDIVGGRFADHFGDLEPFGWGVTRAEALEALDYFLAVALPNFGDYRVIQRLPRIRSRSGARNAIRS